jgi:hypothetical protein
MQHDEFNEVVGAQIDKCLETLGVKALEYATEDRLHNFKIAAALEGISTRKAVAGMMAKHTVSIFDMCGSDDTHTLHIWEEKITDGINYLLLLRAVLEEEAKNANNSPALIT